MSDFDDDTGFVVLDDDSGSDFGSAPVPKAPAAKKARTTAAKPKPKNVAAPKVKPAAAGAKGKKAAPKKKAVLEEHHSNGTDSEMAIDYDDEEDKNDGELAGPSAPAKQGKAKSASETYVKLSQLEHVLKRPDTYIGSIEPITQPMWVYDEPTKKLAYRPTTFVPGLYKIVDEILVNAADNKVRCETENKAEKMTKLEVTIDVKNKCISVLNDGEGIPIEKHKTEKIWIPELIFGQLLTSSNYDDDEAKVTGGRNGYGAKLANIYSTKFIVETASSNDGKLYTQTFKDNMSKKDEPKIRDNYSGKSYTKITFWPDLVRFNMTEFDDNTVSLLQKRVYDMAGVTKGVKVSLNGKPIMLKDFEAYVEMYTQAEEVVGGGKKKKKGAGAPDPVARAKSTVIYGTVGDRWEFAFAVSEGEFTQISFCNSIATTKGGTHVKYLADQIVVGVADLVKKKNQGVPVKASQIKNHITIFVNCLIENPAFDSQTKEHMTLRSGKFGSECKLPPGFLKKVAASGLVDNVLHWARSDQDQKLKQTDSKKRTRINQTKLEDANNAGKRGSKCTLILTEGDSAKALAVSGLNTIGRDNFGVFPLRGKLLNVREATCKALHDNAEIKAIKEIMGLEHKKVYTNTDSLRYGSIMIMADQDHDGSHIKGLIINFLDDSFPSLLKLPGFLLEFITPIVKATRNKKELSFFTIPQYETWKEENLDGRGWSIKYFKGLGTSTAADAKKYFGDMRQHRLPFAIMTDEEHELIDMAFNKKKADNRKEWLRGFIPGTFMDHDVAEVPIADFINKELILFSMADNIRSIPSVVDGFKPGQRKVLFGCFKRRLVSEIKVVQIAGYISEHSAYHHGEVSLTGTIVNLAQDYVGSNNLNLLMPNGQFGTRLQGGKDAASARYIFTNVCKVTRALFHPADDNILEYLNDDGQSIEPKWYTPILPMVLVNGSDGIGTGWSTSIPNYNPADIVANLKRKIAGDALEPMHPWIVRTSDDTVEITELPIRVWTQTYKELLESWVTASEKTPALVKDYKEYHSDTSVHFVVSLTDKGKEAIEKEGLEMVFKLTGKLGTVTTNMVCFDPAGKIKKYATPEEILDDFYDVRLEHYHKRKEFLLNELTNAHDKLSNQARFIQMIMADELVVFKRPHADVAVDLRKKEFRPFPKTRKALVAADPNAGEDEFEDEGADSDFHDLLSMAIWSFTAEKVAKLLAVRDGKEHEVNLLLKLQAEDLWARDLDEFSAQWEDLLSADKKLHAENVGGAKKGAKGKAKRKMEFRSDSEEEEYVAKPAPKKARAAPKPKAKVDVPLPTDDEDEEMAAPAPAPKPKAAAVKKAHAAPKAVKKRPSTELDDDSDDAGPSVPKPKKAPAPKKQKVVESGEDEDDIFSRPIKKPVSPPKPKAVKKVEPVVVASDVSSAAPPVKKAAPAKKAAPKAKEVVDSDDEDDFDLGGDSDDSEPVAAPAASRTARAVSQQPKKYAIEIADDEESDE
ncbi:hypothetical protein RQP46_000201 [Phenoliferia psychrophenolica]